MAGGGGRERLVEGAQSRREGGEIGLALLGGCSSERMGQGWSPGFEQRVNAIVRPSQSRIEPVLPDPPPDKDKP